MDKDPGKENFDARGIKCIFVGYDNSAERYRVWVPSEHRVRILRDVKFFGVTESKEIPDESDTEYKKPEKGCSLDSVEFHFDPLVEERAEEIPERIDVPEVRRGPGRPVKILTGRRGRPKKRYNLVEDNQEDASSCDGQSIADEEPAEELANIAEISWTRLWKARMPTIGRKRSLPR